MKLTSKERKGLQAIVEMGLKGMGGKTPIDLLEDNFSWFKRSDLSEKTGFNKHETSGIMSALYKKGLIVGPDQGDWALTDNGIIEFQKIFEE